MSGFIRRHKVLSVVGIVVLLLALGGMSLVTAPPRITQNVATVTPTPTPDYRTQLQNNMQNAGYSVVTPFTKTTVNGHDVYTGVVLKTGVRFNLQYTITKTTTEATNLREQKIAEYKAKGYTSAGSDTINKGYDFWNGVSGAQTVSIGARPGDNDLAPYVLVLTAVEA
ncbi:MAG: hypothetical protein ACXV2E_05970 [Halobacteriota archaeon]